MPAKNSARIRIFVTTAQHESIAVSMYSPSFPTAVRQASGEPRFTEAFSDVESGITTTPVNCPSLHTDQLSSAWGVNPEPIAMTCEIPET